MSTTRLVRERSRVHVWKDNLLVFTARALMFMNFELWNHFRIAMKTEENQENLYRDAGPRTFQIHTDLCPAVRQTKEYKKSLKSSPTCVLLLSL
jgi:hypothetical protein